MYNNIYELPTAVLNSLNADDANYWMEQYNRCDPESQDEVLKAMKNAWHACATRPSSFSFEIVGSADIIDDYNTIIDLDRIKELLDETIRHGGNIQNDHHNYQIGALWDWKPCKVKQKDGKEVDGVLIYGNLFGGGYVYDKARKSFVDGMNNLSVAGEAPDKAYECDERGCYVRRKLKQLMEISLTRSPGNKDCTLQWYNKDAAIARSTSVGIPIHEYTIHRDESTCPILSLQKALEKIGYECSAHHDGVHIPMNFEEYANDEMIFRSHGLDIEYYDGYASVKRSLMEFGLELPEPEEPQHEYTDEEVAQYIKDLNDFLGKNDKWYIKQVANQNWPKYGYLKNNKERMNFVDNFWKEINEAKKNAYEAVLQKRDRGVAYDQNPNLYRNPPYNK